LNTLPFQIEEQKPYIESRAPGEIQVIKTAHHSFVVCGMTQVSFMKAGHSTITRNRSVAKSTLSGEPPPSM
jgi:hypothetical protein